MPSAASKASSAGPPINMPDLLHEPIKNVVCVLDKKLRNLEKRKIKLVETKRKAEEGSELNEDQKKALENLTLVDNSLATVKDVHKHLSQLEQEYLKLLKRDQKRVKQEQKELFEGKSQDSVCRTIQVQAILGELSEDVRPDFLNATNGACQLSEDELSNLDAFYELINLTSEEKSTIKFSNRVKEVGLHLWNLVEGKEKPVLENVTYKQLNDVITRIQESAYFDKDDDIADEEEEEVVQQTEEEQEEEEEDGSVEGDEEMLVETTENTLITFTDDSPVEEFATPDAEPLAENFTENEEASSSEEVQPETEVPVMHMETTNGVDLPPEVQQMQQTPDNEKIDFMGESEISPAMLESQQQSLNPVSPEFIPRNMQPVVDDGNGWGAGETPAVGQTTSEWTETPITTAESEWQAVPEFQANQHGAGGGSFRGRGGGRGGRGFGRGGRGGDRRDNRDNRGDGRGGGFRGGRQGGYNNDGGRDGYNNRDGNYRGNRGNRGDRGGDRGGGSRGPRGGGGGRGGGGRGGGGRGGFGGGFGNRNSAPQ